MLARGGPVSHVGLPRGLSRGRPRGPPSTIFRAPSLSNLPPQRGSCESNLPGGIYPAYESRTAARGSGSPAGAEEGVAAEQGGHTTTTTLATSHLYSVDTTHDLCAPCNDTDIYPLLHSVPPRSARGRKRAHRRYRPVVVPTDRQYRRYVSVQIKEVYLKAPRALPGCSGAARHRAHRPSRRHNNAF